MRSRCTLASVLILVDELSARVCLYLLFLLPPAPLSRRERKSVLTLHIPDADHGAANVTLELQMLVPVLQPGDYVVVEDTNLDGHEHAVAPGWGPSPYDAITHFMAMNRDVFERDLQREVKFGFSQAMAVRLRVRVRARVLRVLRVCTRGGGRCTNQSCAGRALEVER